MESGELLEYIYKAVDMGSHSCMKLLEDLRGKDNKIIDAIEDIKKEYLSFQIKVKELTEKYKVNLKSVGVMAKMGSSMEMKMEVMKDNSDSKIADMLIRGNTMGIIEIEKNIHKLADKSQSDVVELAQELIKFQNASIKKLKKYL